MASSHTNSLEVVSAASTTFINDTMDETLGKRAPHSVEGTGRACRLAANRDLVGVTTEIPDILLHPPHGYLLIQYPIVSRAVVSGLSKEVGVGEKSKGSESIVDCHHDDSFRC